MSTVFRVCDTIVYDQDQGAFMFYLPEGLRMIPQHFVSGIETGEDFIDVVCKTKHSNETVRIECNDPVGISEKLTIILEDF